MDRQNRLLANQLRRLRLSFYFLHRNLNAGFEQQNDGHLDASVDRHRDRKFSRRFIGTEDTVGGFTEFLAETARGIESGNKQLINLNPDFPGLGSQNPFRCKFEVPDGATATLSRRQVSEIREIKATRAWTLAEMSGAPNAVADFHAKLTIEVGPVAANHCARVTRAVYRHAMRTNRGLPLALPTSGVDFNVEQRREVATRDFKAWAKAWRAIPNGNRRAFHLLNLLGGFRPGELVRLKWVDVLLRERVVIIRNAKAGPDIRVPMSAAIARVLKMARDSVTEPDEFVFPARGPRGHIVRFDSDALPFYANALRHTWRTIATDCGVDDTLAHLMLGHAPRGVSQGYLSRMVLSSWPAMRAASAGLAGGSFRSLARSKKKRPRAKG